MATGDKLVNLTSLKAVNDKVAESISSLSGEIVNVNSHLSDTLKNVTVNGDVGILVPFNALPFADVLSVGTSITGAKTTGKNLYPYGDIPRYTYGFYTSTIATAKTSGIRLVKGVYTLSYTSSKTSSRLCLREFYGLMQWLNEAILLLRHSIRRHPHDQIRSDHRSP